MSSTPASRAQSERPGLMSPIFGKISHETPSVSHLKWEESQDNVRHLTEGLPRWLSGQEPVCQYRRCRFSPWIGKIPWWREWLPTLVFLPRESQWQRSLAGYSPWGHQESDTTEQLTLSPLTGSISWSPLWTPTFWSIKQEWQWYSQHLPARTA